MDGRMPSGSLHGEAASSVLCSSRSAAQISRALLLQSYPSFGRTSLSLVLHRFAHPLSSKSEDDWKLRLQEMADCDKDPESGVLARSLDSVEG